MAKKKSYSNYNSGNVDFRKHLSIIGGIAALIIGVFVTVQAAQNQTNTQSEAAKASKTSIKANISPRTFTLKRCGDVGKIYGTINTSKSIVVEYKWYLNNTPIGQNYWLTGVTKQTSQKRANYTLSVRLDIPKNQYWREGNLKLVVRRKGVDGVPAISSNPSRLNTDVCYAP